MPSPNSLITHLITRRSGERQGQDEAPVVPLSIPTIPGGR
jgi:hypothetical protein